MALASMTGFAREAGSAAGWRWTLEAKSVNGRNLDLKFRLAPPFDHLAEDIRREAAARFSRGSFFVSLAAEPEAGETSVRINEAALVALAEATRRAAAVTGLAAPGLDALIGVRGIVEVMDASHDEEALAAVSAAIRAGIARLFDQLAEARRAEGARLRDILSERLTQVERLVAQAETLPARTPEAIRARLASQVAALLEASPALDPQRLHQEAVLIATRVDVREELDRLTAHVAAARDLIRAGAGIGRKLDFLSQEFSREANTLCSKSNDVGLTRIGLELKSIVDQVREQAQNVE